MTPDEFRAIRDSLGLTRAELASALGITGKRPQAGIENWEAGRAPIPPIAETAMRAIAAFGLPSTWPTSPR